MSQYINGTWSKGSGPEFVATDPATGEVIWRGCEATADEVNQAVTAAKEAFADWSMRSFEDRLSIAEAYRDILKARKDQLAQLIAQDAGKALWDATGEATAMANKIDISVKAYHDRTPTRDSENGAIIARLAHRPHGVMAVFGPYNFPGHLPNGHIVPALIAGNTAVFKPSEITPAVAEFMVKAWEDAGLPKGVLNLVQGGRDTGAALVANEDINGLLFTGSVRTGRVLSKALAGRPEVLQALEMGGNNPLIVHEVEDKRAAAVMTILSGYVSSGQRCTCARRLIVPTGADGDAFIDTLSNAIDGIRVGTWQDADEPFMGPLATAQAAEQVETAYNELVAKGAKVIRPLKRLRDLGDAFVSPGLLDVTGVDVPDEEIFGPLLQITRVADFDEAIKAANDTRFGLASGLISDNRELFEYFYPRAQAGIVNWNQQLTGAASTAPFGGVGDSGNHRPSAYYAADYCAYGVASMIAASGKAELGALPKGLDLGDDA